MKNYEDTATYNEHLKKIFKNIGFGFIVSVISIAAYRLTGGEILCTAIENLISPNLMIFVATSALSLHFLSIFKKNLRKTAENLYSFSTELAALLTGTIIALFLVYYFEEFGFKFHAFLIPASLTMTKLIIMITMLTTLPLFLLLKYQLNKENYSKGTNFYISVIIGSFAAVGIVAVLIGSKVESLPVCKAEKTAQLSYEIFSQQHLNYYH